MNGALIISLDYELMWGMIDVAEKDGYGLTNVMHVPEAIERMLTLFEQYGIHATFAIVGMIMREGKEEILSDLPSEVPIYLDTNKSPYENEFIQRINPDENALFFQNGIVNKLKGAKNVEIGTHTYCHYYCWEEGQTLSQFEADIKKALAVASERGIMIESIVFPRNQCSKEHLSICARYGIKTYRGNALKYFDKPHSQFEAVKNRICRLIDTYYNLGGYTTIPYDSINMTEIPLNLRASRLLRPYSKKLFFLEGIKIRRIKREMLHAAKNGEVYHLWWHPHNFGSNMDNNLSFLEAICKYYQCLHRKYGFQSFTMAEMYKVLKYE